MHRDAVLYKGYWLHPNSKSFQLLKEGKLKELAELDKECARREARLIKVSDLTPKVTS